MARELVNIINKKNQKNYLINGNFDFFQRGLSITSSSNVYVADRWRCDNTANNTWSRQTDGAPLNSNYYIRYNSDASGGFQFFQALENNIVKEIQGKEMTFSFLVRRSAGWTGGLQVRVQSSTTPNDSIAADFSSNLIQSLDIDNADIPVRTPDSSDWVRFSVTFTMPFSEGLRLNVVTPSLQIAGQNIEIAQAMLTETSIIPKSFVYHDINYVGELVACQKYYEKSYDLDIAPGTIDGNGLARFTANTSGAGDHGVNFSVSKRQIPSMTLYSTTTGNSGNIRDFSGGVDRPITTSNNGQSAFSFTLPAVSTTNGRHGYQWTADAEI